MKSVSVGGSIIGSPQQIKDMLALAVKHNVKSWYVSLHPAGRSRLRSWRVQDRGSPDDRDRADAQGHERRQGSLPLRPHQLSGRRRRGRTLASYRHTLICNAKHLYPADRPHQCSASLAQH
jgi:hypothetical protein